MNARLTLRDLPPAAPCGSLTVVGDTRVHRTAHAELTALLVRHAPHLKVVAGLSSDLPASADSYELRPVGDTLHVLGGTPRGLLHAAFALEELLLAGDDDRGVLRRGTFHFRERIFHARFAPWPGTRADVRFLAHLGATHCLVCHDWQGTRRSLQGYVTSPIFPDAVDAAEVSANHAGLRRLLDDCADHGLGAMLWLTELPCQGGPWVPPAEREKFLTRFPADVLSDSGTYEGQVLCFSHPRVQEFYRDLLRRFFADFPEIETLFLFGLDSGGEFCDPAACPRCRGLSRFAQRDRFVCFLVEEGQKVRPGLRVLTTGWGWDAEPAEFLRRQSALPGASGLYLAAQKDGWQCERQSHEFLHAARRVCRERGQTFIGYDNFHWGDDSVHGLGDIQDFPLGIAAKLRRWHALGADGVFDHWGHAPEDIWCNSVACREFFLDPHADASAFCRSLSVRQFGPAAGPLAFAAWEALERAHTILSAACTWSPGQWPMWYAGRRIPPLPGHFDSTELLRTQPPSRREGDSLYNPPALADSLAAVADAWQRASPHFTAAERALADAEALADETPVFYQFWHTGPAPTRREHLRRQRLYIASVARAGREIGGHFGLHALWETCGHDATAYRARASTALVAQAHLCRDAAAYFDSLSRPKDWPAHYSAKAAAIAAYLTPIP